jgi:Transcriptional regulators
MKPARANSRVGIRDVADAAEVSVTTVSQVVSGNRPVSEKTRAKVKAAIAELGYRPHPGAASLRNQRTMAIALVVPDLTNPFYPLVAAGLQDILMPRGYMLTISDLVMSSAKSSEVVQHFLNRRVDGIVIASYGVQESDFEAIEESGIALVTLGAGAGRKTGDLVHSDDTEGMREMTTHLIERGYKRIAFIGGEELAAPTRLRFDGYCLALKEAGREVNLDLVRFAEFTRDGGHDMAQSLLSIENPPDAIVAANDLIAIGVLDSARARGLAVPGQLAVTGYDDIDAAALVSPELTTVLNPAREIGRACARLLLERLDGEVSEVSRTVALSHSLIVRQSS